MVTGSTVTTATYSVNHYTIVNGLPYILLQGDLFNPPLYTNGPVTSYAFTSTSASPAVFTTAAPAGITWVNGQAVKLGGAVIGGTNFKTNTVYYVVAQSTDTFELALTAGGTAINGDGTTTGAGYVYLVNANEVGEPEYSGETGDVSIAPGSPFEDSANAVLVSQILDAQADADGTVVTIESGDVVAGSDVPTVWTVLYTFPTGTECGGTGSGTARGTCISTWSN